MPTLSVVINTKNAAKTLPRTLQSVTFADEIVVVDMQSTDETKTLAAEVTDSIYDYDDVGYVEPARNFAISKASSEWIVIVDVDE
jgi:glycosyltransferase involved in cell wall biosynthesis